MSEENKPQALPINDIANQHTSPDAKGNSLDFMYDFFEKIFASIQRGIFLYPPFSLQLYFPDTQFFKLGMFKTFWLFVFYLAFLAIYVYEPGTLSQSVFKNYVIGFWIVLLAIMILVTNPYDPKNMEYKWRK